MRDRCSWRGLRGSIDYLTVLASYQRQREESALLEGPLRGILPEGGDSHIYHC
ncbi:hypothetical protein ES703_62682 [subsurface metagenome]